MSLKTMDNTYIYTVGQEVKKGDCENCEGAGWFLTLTKDDDGNGYYKREMCRVCYGTGKKQKNRTLKMIRIYSIFHRGKENAITRADFLDRFGNRLNIEDRDLRRLYSYFSICTCNRGGFWPVREEEVEEFKVYLRKKALAHFTRWSRLYNRRYDLMGKNQTEMLF
ncbi:MAG: hypothetical protein ACOC5G_04035 [Acidobacteriota bacterium]